MLVSVCMIVKDEEEIIAECGNNLLEEGEECDGTKGLTDGFECSFNCELVIIAGCINDGNCTQKEMDLGLKELLCYNGLFLKF